MTAELIDRLRGESQEKVKAIVQKIATESPTLADLGEEQLEQLARVVVAETLKEELRKAADLEKVPYGEERETYLARASRTASQHTRTAYRAALDRLDVWCKQQGISPLELTPARADDWIESLKAERRAPSSIHLTVAAASSFWTWLERRHVELRNPFRGTKSRPPRKATRKLEVPSDAEVRMIKNAAEGWLKAAIVVMSQRGLRAGALPALSITGARYTCTTKGKEQTGKIPEEVREAIKKAGLSLRSPFKDKKVNQIEDAVKYLTKKLHSAGQIGAAYSAHDLRHAFAVNVYTATRDVYATRKALGHASVTVTETYLRSLGVDG